MAGPSDSCPPLDVEEALDLVIAMAAHTSDTPAQAEFGKMLIQQHFEELPQQYADDPIASAYLRHLLACMAAAVRGFAVQRRRWSGTWQSLLRQRDQSIAHLDRLGGYSPLNKEGWLWRALGWLGGGAAGGVLAQVLDAQRWVVALAAVLGMAVGLPFADWYLSRVRTVRVKQVLGETSDLVHGQWQADILAGYKLIARDFLLSALKVREKYYPHLTSISGEKLYDRYEVAHVDFGPAGAEAAGPLDELHGKLYAIVQRHLSLG